MSRPEWSADRTFSEAEVAAWLRASGRPTVGEVRWVAEGFDNAVFEADGLYVRVCRRRIAAEDIIKEIALLPHLGEMASRFGMAVPTPRVVPSEVATLDWPWFAYNPVDGAELGGAVAGGQPLYHVASALGRFLRALHGGDVPEEVRISVREDELRRTDMPFRRMRAHERIAQLEGAGLDVDASALRRLVDAGSDLPVMPHVALVHGDLHFRHVLLGASGRLSGIIDWGDAHFGNPCVDLHGYWAFLRPDERESFASAYGPIDELTLRAARVISVYINAVLALSAQDFGLPAVGNAALEALRRTALD